MMGNHNEPLKRRLETIPPPPVFLPGYEEMMTDLPGWEEKNLTVFGSCLEISHQLCEAIGRSDSEIQKAAEDLFSQESNLQAEDFCTRWNQAWEETTQSLVDTTKMCIDMPGVDESFGECLKSAKNLHWSATTLPFPYVTKKDLDRMHRDLANVKLFAEKRVAGGRPAQRIAT